MSTSIGVIFVGYGTKDLLSRSLTPWIALRKDPEYKVSICAVSLRFAGFEGEDDGTQDELCRYFNRGDIDLLIRGPNDIPETQARGMALTYLKNEGCDILIQWDSDESADMESLKTMLAFTEANPFVCWFRFAYSNLVFDERTRLADPFTPPRAFRTRFGNKEAWAFSGDNDIYYSNPRGPDGRALNDEGSYYTFLHELPSVTIPESVFRPLHYSWLADTPERAARSRAKIRYQLEGRKWPSCSFSWDDAQGGLIFNPALPRPSVITSA